MIRAGDKIKFYSMSSTLHHTQVEGADDLRLIKNKWYKRQAQPSRIDFQDRLSICEEPSLIEQQKLER